MFPTRLIDLETEGHIIDRVRELRSKLSNRIKGDLNFAYAKVEIEEINKDKLPDPSKTRGKVKLFTELDTCGSCSRIIDKFHKDYPNIDIEVIHNADKIVEP